MGNANIAIVDKLNSTNFVGIKQIYKPTPGTSGFITALGLTVKIKSIPAAYFPAIPDDTPLDVVEQLLLNLESEIEFKILQLYIRKNSESWVEKAEIRIFNKEPYYEIDLMPYFSKANTIDVAEELSLGVELKPPYALTAADNIAIFGTGIEEKKNDPELETLGDRITALENLLGLFGAATPAAAGTNGLVKGAAAGESSFLLRGDRTWQNPATFATPAYIDNAILGLVAGAPGALNTLDELANALADDANFASTVTNALATKVGVTNTETISGAKTFSAPEGLVITNNLTVGAYINQASRQFKGAASANQSIPNSSTTPTKVNLPEMVDTHAQYNNSRLTAVGNETWRVSLILTFNTTATARSIVSVYKNGVDVAGLSRVLDTQVSVGFSSTPLITIPEISLITGEYLEIFVLLPSGTLSIYGDANQNASYWYGTRIR